MKLSGKIILTLEFANMDAPPGVETLEDFYENAARTFTIKKEDFPALTNVKLEFLDCKRIFEENIVDNVSAAEG